ncbi:CsgG/HfaB family protein [Pectinatus haikarae]|uniref:TolB-like protein n=1 Tax=Pectinatus haikarae TaxID=349096 RepID=A0ABT9Y7T8_9FIRM|nr:CsgG/HfaB family protein [Pectinatus haikarae]MDQ0203901.1 TolB-like protein [Pectinatus haikarae]
MMISTISSGSDILLSCRKIPLIFLLTAIFTALLPALSYAANGTAAVLPFTDDSGKRLGTAAGDIFTARLTDEAVFTLISNPQLSALTPKNNYGSSGDLKTALETGRMLNVDYLIIGHIDSASMEKNSVIFASQYEATVRLNIRIISCFTGETVYSSNAEGTDQNIKIKGFGGKADYTNALEDAADKIMHQLNRNYPVYAKIAAVNGEELYINAGSQSGIKSGDIFTIYETGAAVIDPDTGKMLTYQKKKIGTLKIIRVESHASVGQLQNKASPQIGQTVIKEG